MSKFFNILSGLAVIIFMTVAVLLVISSFNIPGLPLDARTVLTGSMEPTIPVGSVVFIYPQKSYSEGDVVTFKRRESSIETPITHRIVSVANDESGLTAYTTKGDGNDYQDASVVYQDEVSGQVIFHLPFLGKLLDLAKTPWGFAVLIVIPALLVIVDEIKKIRQEFVLGRKEIKKVEEKDEDADEV